MSEISNPHDSFFRETFSRKEIATDFLDHYLPESLRQHLDLDTLSMSKDSFVDKELRHHFSDLLYTVQYKQQDLHLYLLFEHKSSPDPWIGLQLLRYMVKIWEQGRKQHPEAQQLPIIVPLVLYHGRQRWTIPDTFSSLLALDDEHLQQYIPDFHYQLHDFSPLSNEEIRGRAMGKITLLVLKHIFDPDLRDKLPAMLKLLTRVSSQQTALEILETLLRYVVTATQNYTEQDVLELLDQASMGEDIMKTFIDKYIEQGMQQGVRQTGSKILGSQLSQRFGTLPDWAASKIKNADLDTLEKWSLRVLSAKTLDEVFH